MPRFSDLGLGLAERYRRLATLWVLVPTLTALVVFLVLFQVTGRMVTPAGAEVLDLQKAFTPARFGAVVAAWTEGIEAFKWSLIVLDFAFPLLYAVGLASLVALAAGPGPGRVALWLFALPGAAAALDWIENLLHLWLLRDVHGAADVAVATYPALPVLTAALAAMLKFALLLTASGGAVVMAARRHRWWAAVVGLVLFASFTPVVWS